MQHWQKAKCLKMRNSKISYLTPLTLLRFCVTPKPTVASFFTDLNEFVRAWWKFLSIPTKGAFSRFEKAKGKFAESLYKQRGKLVRPFVHSGMATLSVVGVMIAPIVSQELPGGQNPWQLSAPSAVLSAATENPEMSTLVSDKPRDKAMEYMVKEGDTISSIAQTYGVSQETIIWQNNLPKKATLKQGQKLEILPVTGVSHVVQKGETIYSISKKYQAEPQAIVDFTFNTFVNDETFALAVGQTLIIPDGVKPEEAVQQVARREIPLAGAITASGVFVWPTSGHISQGYSWYHSGIDIANPASPDVLAADSGVVVTTGWPDNSGYGNRIIIDHGNGYKSLYGHLAQFYVQPGDKVIKGQAIGKMGTTGRSTGIHLHFEIRQGNSRLNPFDFLK